MSVYLSWVYSCRCYMMLYAVLSLTPWLVSLWPRSFLRPMPLAMTSLWHGFPAVLVVTLRPIYLSHISRAKIMYLTYQTKAWPRVVTVQSWSWFRMDVLTIGRWEFRQLHRRQWSVHAVCLAACCGTFLNAVLHAESRAFNLFCV